MSTSKLITLLFLALLVMGLVRCRKERSCTCVNTPSFESSNGQSALMNGLRTTTTVTVYKNTSKSDLKSFCGNSSYVSQQVLDDINGGTFTITSISDIKCSISN